jgi:hypothetical protein
MLVNQLYWASIYLCLDFKRMIAQSGVPLKQWYIKFEKYIIPTSTLIELCM